MTGETSAVQKNRSVNDFDSLDDVAKALMSMQRQRSEIRGGQYVSLTPLELGNPSQWSTDSGENGSVVPEESGKEKEVNGNSTLDPKLDWVLENFDRDTCEVQTIDEELRRLMVLKSYLMLDGERKESFERITGLASRIFSCPMALISLVDIGRQWFMSNRGLGDTRETNRKSAFCAHAIMSKDDFLIVQDATKDFRFKDNPLVTGAPHIRFYAGAPLLTPEGYKLGTLCILDRKPRPNGLSFDEKQILMELAALAVQSAVDHKRKKLEEHKNPAQMIAYTAHDLLTPLTGVQLSLSLLSEDVDFAKRLNSQQKEMMNTASTCADMMGKICETAIKSFRDSQRGESLEPLSRSERKDSLGSMSPIAVSKLVKSLYIILGPLPKRVPLVITVESDVPAFIVTDEIKVFRSCVNFLTNACTVTEHGVVQLTISRLIEDGKEKLLFECKDTGPGVTVDLYPKLFKPVETSQDCDGDSCLKSTADGGIEPLSSIGTAGAGLGLYSVAVQISSLSGQYGYRPRTLEDGIDSSERSEQGSVFWFKIPLRIPSADATARSSMSGTTTSSDGAMVNDEKLLNVSLVQVHSKLSLSDELAGEVYESFTKVLEGVNTNTLVTVVNDSSKAANLARRKAVELSSDGSRKKRALVIDDSKVIRKSIARVLTKLGYEAMEAEDGMEGFQQLQGSLFDVVFCDFLMPVMDGLDCVMQYREWEAAHRPFFRQYILGISAHAGDNDASKGREVGMDDFWPKPVTYKQLAELEKSDPLQKTGKLLDTIASEGTMMFETKEVHQESLNGSDHGQSSTDSQCSDEEDFTRPMPQRKVSSTVHVCLVGIDREKEETAKSIEACISKNGWKAAIVHDGEEALKLMRMRNWDLVILDEDLPTLQSTECVAKFREWEDKNRVCRQRNIVLLNASGLSTTSRTESLIQLPHGFDLSLAKPVRPCELEYLMLHASRSESDYGVREFVAR